MEKQEKMGQDMKKTAVAVVVMKNVQPKNI